MPLLSLSKRIPPTTWEMVTVLCNPTQDGLYYILLIVVRDSSTSIPIFAICVGNSRLKELNHARGIAKSKWTLRRISWWGRTSCFHFTFHKVAWKNILLSDCWRVRRKAIKVIYYVVYKYSYWLWHQDHYKPINLILWDVECTGFEWEEDLSLACPLFLLAHVFFGLPSRLAFVDGPSFSYSRRHAFSLIRDEVNNLH